MTNKLKENTSSKNTSPEEKLKNQLWENSEDFLDLQRLVKESNWKISWEWLSKYTQIINWQVEWIYWEWYLDLMWTKITSLWKFRKAWDLNFNWVSTLEDLSELEECWDLFLWGTKITSLWKLKKVWNILLEWVSTLKDLGKLEECWNLDLRWTSITTLGKLKKAWDIYLYWASALENLGELEECRDLNLRWTSIWVQLEAIRKINSWELKVNWIFSYDKMGISNDLVKLYFSNYKLFEPLEINNYEFIKSFKEIYGEPWKRDEEVGNICYLVAQKIIKQYKDSLVKYRDTKWVWEDKYNEKEITKIEKDFDEKKNFFIIIFWERVFNELMVLDE